MALDVQNDFKEVGGPGNSPEGGQVYSAFSSTDNLSTMLAADYLDGLLAKVNARDIVILSGTNGTIIVKIDTVTTSSVIFGPTSYLGAATPQSGAGALNVLSEVIDITSTGADALTLADGQVGQVMTITLIVDGGTATLTPANGLGYSTIAFADAGDTAQLVFKTGGWTIISTGGLGGGPVVA